MIDLQVRDEIGNILAHSAGVSWDESLVEIDRADLPMIAGLCPYADTIFNSWQRPMLLEELDRLPAERGPWVDRVRAMCRTAEEESHRYLWFVGD
ncbi:hypothetical protein QF035_011079 [Streptomyces umbrinus]|uniref:GNAT family N-acetyltransferase n=1 Tax=Streptomyces umbrinus TaxID=67370 RepID=A0ABU0TCG6_9ACTN|nr:hypothetical protein [Streptomyces umbrinus]MDQ1033497.1 hypothetical protein [Streptomyces umbrinus]